MGRDPSLGRGWIDDAVLELMQEADHRLRSLRYGWGIE